MRKTLASLGCALVVAGLMASIAAESAQAQVPENIYQAMLKIGQIVDPACTAKLYRPFMPKNDYNSTATPLYPGITVERDVKFGPHDKDLIDIFKADSGPASRPVVIYIPGGGGNKIEQQNREANAFYDNIGRWATKNGMVAVLLQRHPGQNWDDPAKDVSTMIQWLQANIAKYNGNADRMFAWAQSAGNGPLGTYVGRPEVHGPKGVGLRGAIYMAGGWNVAPLVAAGGGGGRGGAPGGAPQGPQAGATCDSGGPGSTDGAIVGPSAATPRAGGPGRGGAPAGGPPAGAPGAGAPGGGGRGQVDDATQLARSTLPEYKKTSVKLMFVTPELDPGITGSMSTFYQTLHDELCKAGADKCPTMLFARRHNHMSVVFSPDTPDTSVSGPVLNWMRSVP